VSKFCVSFCDKSSNLRKVCVNYRCSRTSASRRPRRETKQSAARQISETSCTTSKGEVSLHSAWRFNRAVQMKKSNPTIEITINNKASLNIASVLKKPTTPTTTSTSSLSSSQNGMDKTTKNRNKIFVGGLTNLCPGNLEEVMTNHFSQYGMKLHGLMFAYDRIYPKGFNSSISYYFQIV
jgi:hypothetical protein